MSNQMASSASMKFLIGQNTSFKQLLFLPLSLLFILLFIFTLIKDTNIHAPSHQLDHVDDLQKEEKTCDLAKGEWTPFDKKPYYTNSTCKTIPDHQNCIKFGRPDTEFINWRWKPDECELPMFDPVEFLEIVRGKSLVFVSDSLGGNQMDSLLCMLETVADPEDISYKQNPDTGLYRQFLFTDYNFSVAILWSPFLVKSSAFNLKNQTKDGILSLYLDEPDESWSNKIETFDYVIVSGGNWFFRPFIYYEKGKIIGCHNCGGVNNITEIKVNYGYKRAMETVFKTLRETKNYKGVTFLRTYSPGHFENGAWDNGGNCIRKKPFSKNEKRFDGYIQEMYLSQVEAFEDAEREGKKENRGLSFELISTTEAMLMRPDAHPNLYRDKKISDCVHWCLPGPIDMWNEMLLVMLKKVKGKVLLEKEARNGES